LITLLPQYRTVGIRGLRRAGEPVRVAGARTILRVDAGRVELPAGRGAQVQLAAGLERVVHSKTHI